jgi:hypothetical protein
MIMDDSQFVTRHMYSRGEEREMPHKQLATELQWNNSSGSSRASREVKQAAHASKQDW